MKIIIDNNTYELNSKIGNEDCLTEYKEFFLNKNLSLTEIKNLENRIISDKILNNVYNCILQNYIDKYSIKYILSLSNIDKLLLDNYLDKNFSNLYIGVSDDGIITGIPIKLNMIDKLVKDIECRLNNYFEDIIGLHLNKGDTQIQIGYETYYDFNKIIDILKKHTKFTIHILKKNNLINKDCEYILNYIKEILVEEINWNKNKEYHNNLMKMKYEYNMKYSQPFYKLIRSDIMIEFKHFTSIKENLYFDILFILQEKIQEREDVYKYLLDGLYIKDSLFPEDNKKDIYYGNIIKIFLEEYKIYKHIQLTKNKKVKKFKKRNPKRKLNGLLKNISCFNQYLFENNEIEYIMISISLPIIKDKNVFIGFKGNSEIQILQRSYDFQIYIFN